MPGRQYLTVEAVAKRDKRSPRTIRGWITKGCVTPTGRIWLEAIRAGKMYSIDGEDLENLRGAAAPRVQPSAARSALTSAGQEAPHEPDRRPHPRPPHRDRQVQAGTVDGNRSGREIRRDILCGNSKRPTPAALAKLSAVIGVDLAALPVQWQVTAADMEQMLPERPPADWSTSKVSARYRPSAFCSEVRRRWSAATILDRSEGRAWLSGTTAAAQGMAGSTFDPYSSHLRDLFDVAAGTGRPRAIRDVSGPWRILYDAIKNSAAKPISISRPGPSALGATESG